MLSQTYCYAEGGHRQQLAYDFALPVGDTIVAARDGEVMEIRQDLADTGNAPNPGDHNHIFIRHKDGTVAFYAHIKQQSVLVLPGEKVNAGQPIALSGNSGNTMNFPHLHFGVYAGWPAQEGLDVPVKFSNLEGPLNTMGILIADQWYKAMPVK